MWGATNQPNPTCRQHSDNRKSLKKTCDANNFGTAAKILILKKVLRNNPTFRNFLWKNIRGLLWWPPTPPPPRGKKFWNFFSSSILHPKINTFLLLRKFSISYGLNFTVNDCSTIVQRLQKYFNDWSLKIKIAVILERLHNFEFRQKF